MASSGAPFWNNEISDKLADRLYKGANSSDWVRAELQVPSEDDTRYSDFRDSQPGYRSIQNKKTVVLKYEHHEATRKTWRRKSKHVRVLAVKISKGDSTHSTTQFRHIEKEIKVMTHILKAPVDRQLYKIDHLLLMSYNYISEQPGRSPIVITSFMSGGPLSSYISPIYGFVMFGISPLALIQLKLELCIDIASALAYLHTCGVLHRDLKPKNIFLDSSKRAYIADFDLAWIYGDNDESRWAGSAGYSIPAHPEYSFFIKTDGRINIEAYHYSCKLREILPPVQSWARDLYPTGLIFYMIWAGMNDKCRDQWSYYSWSCPLETYQSYIETIIEDAFTSLFQELPNLQEVSNVVYNLMKMPVTTPEYVTFEYAATNAWKELLRIQSLLESKT